MTTKTDILAMQNGDKLYLKPDGFHDFRLHRYDNPFNTETSRWEVTTALLPSTIVAAQWLQEQGFRAILSENISYPMKNAGGAVFFVELDEKALTELPEDVEEDAMSVDAMLDGPDFTKAKTMTKDAMEDYADQWGVQISTAQSKPKMLEEFKAGWDEKLQGDQL